MGDDADLDGADAEGVGMLINSLMGNGFMQFLSKRTQQMHRELAQLGEDEDDDEDFDPDEVQGDEDDSSEDADDNQEDSEEDGETDEEGEEADESKECEKKEEDATSKSPKKPTASANGDESKTEKSDKEHVNTLEEVNDASEDANGIDKMKEEDNKAEVKQEIKEEGNSSGIATGDSMNADETAEKVNKSPERKCAKQVNGDCNEENSHDKNGESKAPLGDQSKFAKEDASEDETLLGDDLDDNLMQKPGYDSGCTAVVALKVNSKVYVANAGDSRCVMCKGGKAIALSRDHTPAVPEEVERVVSAGGKIQSGRVDGGLNLTRAIGDHRYKQESELPPEKQRISCMPEITVTDLTVEADTFSEASSVTESGDQTEKAATGSHTNGSTDDLDSPDFLIVGCDGLWECLPNEVAVQFVKENVKTDNLFTIAKQMAQKCIGRSCNTPSGLDNVTAIVATLKSHELTEKFSYVPETASANKPDANSTYTTVFDESSSNDKEVTANGSDGYKCNGKENGVNGNHVSETTPVKDVNENNHREQTNKSTDIETSVAKTEDLKRRNDVDSVSPSGDTSERDAKKAKTDLSN